VSDATRVAIYFDAGRESPFQDLVERGFGQTDNLLLNGVLNQLRLVVDIQLSHQVELVRFHRLDAEFKFGSDLLSRSRLVRVPKRGCIAAP
jgi:hypothetical protein